MDKFVNYIKTILVVLFIIFEEIAWKRVGLPIYKNVSSLKVMEKFKNWIDDINNKTALIVIFTTPFILMEFFGLKAGIAFGSGAIFTAIGLYTIKILLTIPTVIIFKSGKNVLVTFWPIRYGYGLILNLKRSDTFRKVKKIVRKLKNEMIIFKHNYLDKTDGNFKESFQKIYTDLKNT